MNRLLIITVLLLSGVASQAAGLEETNSLVVSSNGLDWESFRIIGEKNIFDSTRTGRSRRYNGSQRMHVYSYFTFHGTMDDTAIFTGEGVPRRGFVKVGELLNGFTVRKIELNHVTLAEPNGNLVTLNIDESMRREDESPWARSDEPPPLVYNPAAPSNSASTNGAPAAALPGGPPGTSTSLVPPPGAENAVGVDPNSRITPSTSSSDAAEILKRLRQRREQEN